MNKHDVSVVLEDLIMLFEQKIKINPLKSMMKVEKINQREGSGEQELRDKMEGVSTESSLSYYNNYIS